MTLAIPAEVIDRLKTLAGPGGWTDDPDRLASRLVEWRGRWSGSTPLMLLPRSTAEVAAIVTFCAGTGTPISVQGGNTGLVGGQIPDGEVLLSLERMDRVLAIDPIDESMTVEAGVTLAAAHEAALSVSRRFPLGLASEGSCTIGGNVSTNAGGTAVLRFGNMRDLVLGLEAVLPDGRIWNGLTRPRKDNTGYDLRQLLCGAEGTLGVVTAARLKLYPLTASRAVAFAGVPSPQAALDLLSEARRESGGTLEGFELMSALGVDLVLRHVPDSRLPLEGRQPWYVLIEVTGAEEGAAMRAMERILTVALESGSVADAVIAQSDAQATAFWAIRENQSAAQRAEGQAWKNDISVPVPAIPAFLERATAALNAFSPGVRFPIFGHVGDGNLHYDILPAEGGDAALHAERRAQSHRIVNDIVAEVGGSISAEHGIGVMKVEDGLRYKDPVEIAAYRSIRASLDPKRILNPRVLF